MSCVPTCIEQDTHLKEATVAQIKSNDLVEVETTAINFKASMACWRDVIAPGVSRSMSTAMASTGSTNTLEDG